MIGTSGTWGGSVTLFQSRTPHVGPTHVSHVSRLARSRRPWLSRWSLPREQLHERDLMVLWLDAQGRSGVRAKESDVPYHGTGRYRFRHRFRVGTSPVRSIFPRRQVENKGEDFPRFLFYCLCEKNRCKCNTHAHIHHANSSKNTAPAHRGGNPRCTRRQPWPTSTARRPRSMNTVHDPLRHGLVQEIQCLLVSFFGDVVRASRLEAITSRLEGRDYFPQRKRSALPEGPRRSMICVCPRLAKGWTMFMRT